MYVKPKGKKKLLLYGILRGGIYSLVGFYFMNKKIKNERSRIN